MIKPGQMVLKGVNWVHNVKSGHMVLKGVNWYTMIKFIEMVLKAFNRVDNDEIGSNGLERSQLGTQ